MPAHAGGMAHSTIREGIITGLLGGTAIAVWFLIVDSVAHRPMHTPALLGAIVTGEPNPIAAADGAERLKFVALYTPIHFILMAAFGLVVVFLTHRAQQHPRVLTLALLLFCAFAVAFIGLVVILEQQGLGDLAWFQVAIGNLIAIVVMGWYVVRHHPGIPALWSRRFEDQG